MNEVTDSINALKAKISMEEYQNINNPWIMGISLFPSFNTKIETLHEFRIRKLQYITAAFGHKDKMRHLNDLLFDNIPAPYFNGVAGSSLSMNYVPF